MDEALPSLSIVNELIAAYPNVKVQTFVGESRVHMFSADYFFPLS